MKKVLITDPLSATGVEVLKQAGLEVIELLDGDNDKLEQILPDIEGWIIRSGTRIGAAEIAKAKNLKAIGRAGVGVDNIDIPAATAHGVVVMNTPGGNTISAAEHTIALMMALARNIPTGDSTMKAGTWARKELKGTELNGKTLGVIGLGRIGQEVGRRGLGLQMNVIGYDPYVSQEQLLVKDITTVTLDELLELADVVTLHMPRNKETLDLIATPELEKMKSAAMLINCARGGLVNESDLANALQNGAIAGAAIDVYMSEPPSSDNPLISAPNIVLTPHLGASTYEAGENVAIQIASQLRDYLVNDRLSNTLNLPISDMSILTSIQDSLDLAKGIGRLQHPLHNGPIKSIRVSYNGDPEHLTPLLYSAFEGMMENRYDSGINLINAKAVADSKSIVLSTLHDPELSHVQNVISVSVESEGDAKWELMGYIDQQGSHRLIRVNNYHVDVLLRRHLILVLNEDVPGVVGEVGTLLAKQKINIAAYSLTRLPGENALSLIKCDSIPTQQVLDELKSITSVKECYFLG
ncbi:MAG: phosphoglycerate dehydrogenase [Candidatus Marinimicrobia bacterium]|nr:phosphoglycerate dehydrogenase [Candidatus Neomarinimicrobiota bacterium]MCF7850171.1 phosphoglycerate dehydrogenase [Candidatus Neomarinimicrobiota bacterium]MCF7905467.1 phosphoglycerate dehydrogenase [Candidatus Neomarinimicrobiota bacterium]